MSAAAGGDLDALDPRGRAELLAALARTHAHAADFFAALPAGVLSARPADGAWSPAEHLRHLVLSVRPVAGALRLPRLVLLLRFGPAFRPSRAYPQLRADYRAALAAGGRASGAFLPRVEDADPAEARARLLEQWRGAGTALSDAAAGWSEASLDRIRLPHPLIGALTVREMLYFTLYHIHHHVAGARGRLPVDAAESVAGASSA
ncbi:MAG: hypothetical protein JWM27_3125 [Gemmatimonadetes bacterium]|nr:hypothetical protein [Gemmatimonadota bacterium]